MERYIKNIHLEQTRKSSIIKVEDVMSPPTGRRESLIFTGFPAEDVRPSLPVTPAPIMTSTFWGGDRAEIDPNLPSAEGVPDQAEWDPAEKLEELRRSSLIEVENLVLPDRRKTQESTKLEEIQEGKDKPTKPAPVQRHSSESMSELELTTEQEESAVVRALEVAAELHETESADPSYDELTTNGKLAKNGKAVAASTFSEPDYSGVKVDEVDPTREVTPTDQELSPKGR